MCKFWNQKTNQNICVIVDSMQCNFVWPAMSCQHRVDIVKTNWDANHTIHRPGGWTVKISMMTFQPMFYASSLFGKNPGDKDIVNLENFLSSCHKSLWNMERSKNDQKRSKWGIFVKTNPISFYLQQLGSDFSTEEVKSSVAIGRVVFFRILF